MNKCCFSILCEEMGSASVSHWSQVVVMLEKCSSTSLNCMMISEFSSLEKLNYSRFWINTTIHNVSTRLQNPAFPVAKNLSLSFSKEIICSWDGIPGTPGTIQQTHEWEPSSFLLWIQPIHATGTARSITESPGMSHPFLDSERVKFIWDFSAETANTYFGQGNLPAALEDAIIWPLFKETIAQCNGLCQLLPSI